MTKRSGSPALSRGFSLIELLVSMAIGLVVTLAITVVMTSGERDKRSTTSVNDINQSGGYAAYLLDRQIRNAGAGFAQRWDAVGCHIKAQNATGPILSDASVFGDPFTRWPGPIRLAPVIIGADLANVPGGAVRGDVLMVMAGTGGFIETPQPVLPGVLASGMKLANTFGFRTGDLVLLTDTGVAGGCMVQQVGPFPAGAASGSAVQAVNFEPGTPAINYHAATVIGGLDVTSFGGSSYAAQIGNVNQNLPQFTLIGVGQNSTLFSNDLLPAGTLAAALLPIADGVVEMRALYGTAPVGATSPVTWVKASTVVGDPMYAASISPTTLRSVVALRLGFILRTSLRESKVVTPAAAITLFSDLPVAVQSSRALVGQDAYYRYRTVELTIPLPNVATAP